jgi:hypothetical protein
MRVTGRDVAEGEYALNFTYPQWILDGQDLAEATKNAAKIRATTGLGDRMAEVIGFVIAKGEARAADVVAALGIAPDQVRVYLSRAAEAGRLRKLGRGLYGSVTSVTSVTSEGDDDPWT